MINILLQTTLKTVEDDWNINRFSLLAEYLCSLRNQEGAPLFAVTARDRQPDGEGNDPVLSSLAGSSFDELWLFGVETEGGLSADDCAGITAFRSRGGGLLAARDHQDVGASICIIGGVGAAQNFHTHNLPSDPANRIIDDTETKSISWPNYHSGRNGDYQQVSVEGAAHALLNSPASPSGIIEFFPSHPHEGAVTVPSDANDSRAIITGRSVLSDRRFNLVVVFEGGHGPSGEVTGRAAAHSSFHHFADYNWDTASGCPSFVTESPGDGMKRNPRALQDIQTYVRNAALWLAPQSNR